MNLRNAAHRLAGQAFGMKPIDIKNASVALDLDGNYIMYSIDNKGIPKETGYSVLPAPEQDPAVGDFSLTTPLYLTDHKTKVGNQLVYLSPREYTKHDGYGLPLNHNGLGAPQLEYGNVGILEDAAHLGMNLQQAAEQSAFEKHYANTGNHDRRYVPQELIAQELESLKKMPGAALIK